MYLKSIEIFINIISGKGSEAQNNVVCANAAMAISTMKGSSPLESFQVAKESLLSKKGLAVLVGVFFTRSDTNVCFFRSA